MNNQITSSPIFIIGAQRSGTTLLRLILNSHSKVAIPEEGDFFIPLLRKYKLNDDSVIKGKQLERFIEYVKNNSQFKLWTLNADKFFEEILKENSIDLSMLISGLYEYYAKSQKKEIWGDKTPSFFRMVPVLADLFPNARFIHIIRDGRDLFLSWRNIDRTKRNISLVALEWKYKINKARKALDAIDYERSFEVKYEDLVTSPNIILQEVCSFLSIEYESKMSDFWKTSNKYIGTHHSALIFQPLTSSSINKWKNALSQKELMKFEAIAGSMLEFNGYELSKNSSRNIISYLNVIIQLSYGLPYRATQVFLTALNYYASAKLGINLFSEGVGERPSKAIDN